jgi:hypothetical protein
MEFLGIGPLELFFIVLIALIVLGPKDMVKAGRTLGRFLRTLVTSPTWKTIQQTSRDLRYLPNRLMREAGIDDLKEGLPETQTIRKEMGLDQVESDMKQWQKEVGDVAKMAGPVISSPPPPKLTTAGKENPEPPADQAPQPQIQPETAGAALPPRNQPEPSPVSDLSAWTTTPPEEHDAARDGKNSPSKPAANSDPDESNSKTTP